MKKSIKELHIAVLAAVISIFLAGCQSAEEQKIVAEPVGPAILTEAMKNDTENEKTEELIETEDVEEEPQPETSEEGFIFQRNDQDIFIPYTDCTCEYDNGDLQIYTKYFEEENEYFSGARTVIRLQTADSSMEILATNEYCIDYENGLVYYVGRDKYDDFISIYVYYSYDVGYWDVGGTQLLNVYAVEDWLAETFGLALKDIEESFSDRRVYVTALESGQGASILKGEASGVHKDTGEYCHVDWEINTETGEEKVSPHEKKIYDEEKDKEVFEACDKAFTEIDGGNLLELSDLNDWKSLVDWDSMEGWEANLWIRMDLNDDNLPELIHLHGYKDWFELPIFAVYTYVGAVMKPLDRVYSDQNDSTEFLYLGSTGNMMYESCNGGMVITGWYAWKEFDEAWRAKTVLGLSFYYFEGETEISSKEEHEFLREQYPDTYGSRGAGCYCYISRPKITGANKTELVEAEITLEEFLSEYEKITGFDYFEANPYYGELIR